MDFIVLLIPAILISFIAWGAYKLAPEKSAIKVFIFIAWLIMMWLLFSGEWKNNPPEKISPIKYGQLEIQQLNII